MLDKKQYQVMFAALRGLSALADALGETQVLITSDIRVWVKPGQDDEELEEIMDALQARLAFRPVVNELADILNGFFDAAQVRRLVVFHLPRCADRIPEHQGDGETCRAVAEVWVHESNLTRLFQTIQEERPHAVGLNHIEAQIQQKYLSAREKIIKSWDED